MSEINRLLKNKDSSIQKLEDQKQLLLSGGENTDKFENLKKDLNWDDTDKQIKDEYRKVLELSHAASEIKDSKILDIDSIHEYCIDNNYVLINITSYKGKISNELLEAIENYCKSNDMRTESTANINKLYLLCPLVDIKANDNIKKSKRYKKNTNLSKIILLEKLDKGNSYSNDLFKIIFEMGEKKHIRDFINSLFKTHYKTVNVFINILPYIIIYFLMFIISLGVLHFNNVINASNTEDYKLLYKFIMGIITLILFIKMFHTNTSTSDSLNCYKYDSLKDFTCNSNKKLIVDNIYINKNNNKLINKIKIRAYVSSIIIIICLNIFAISLFKINYYGFKSKFPQTVKQIKPIKK